MFENFHRMSQLTCKSCILVLLVSVMLRWLKFFFFPFTFCLDLLYLVVHAAHVFT